ncbi:T9SS type B sorting domain-containing protein [Confluentibacter citreus]|uniref:T9SS type B sorting domain-containing protein n=1 Tax=Confluentibacter citreus TaxID=2007307 RepID=UPI000C287E9A|nr:T9SS type B sorting domain-containing protein [Confluentibacter citreus]
MKRNLFCLFFAFLIHSIVFSQWVQTNGPIGAHTNQIVKSGIFLVLNAGNGGIFRSSNNGASWEWSGWGLPCNEQVLALSEYNSTLYASVFKNGIFLSTDNGASWKPINAGIEDKTFYSLFVDRINLFAGNSEGGMYYSGDNGTTWTDRSTGVTDMGFTSFLYFNFKLYAGGRSSALDPSRALFETSDNGLTWKQVIIPGIGPNGVQSMIVKDGLFYVANDDTVFISSDGVIWNATSVDTNASIVSMGVTGNSVYLTTSAGRYFVSPDNGATWNLVQNTSTNAFANHVFFSNGKIIMSTNQGLYESFDFGATWLLNNTGITGLKIESFGENGNSLFAGTNDQGVFRSADGGLNWELINTGINTFNSLHVTSIVNVNGDMYLGTGDGVYKSTNNGNSWDFIFNPGLNISTHALDYDSGVLVTGASGTGIYISKDFGVTWTLVSTNGISTNVDYESIEIIGNTIIVSTNNSELFISQDLGASWTNRSIPGGFSTTSDLQLINNKLYAATSRGLFVSDNLGVGWSLYNTDIKMINDIVIDGDKIYAATNTGVYVTNQTFGEWYPLCEGLGIQNTNEIYIKDNVLFAGTFASSVWRRFKIIGGLPPLEDERTIGINDLMLCPDSSEINLFTYAGLPASARGEWTPSLSKNGFFTPGLDAEGTYKFVYENDLCGCEAYIKVNVSLEGLFAGNDNDMTLCTISESVNLFESLGPYADEGGVWTPALASGTGVFDPKIDVQGIYTYTVTNNGCPNDFSEVNVIVSDDNDVGIGGDFVLCYSQTPINLFTLLGGTPDVGGEWIPKLAGTSGLFNPAIEKSGTYTYYFPDSECSQDKAEIQITLVTKANPGISNGTVQVCVNSGGVDLFNMLGTNADSGGFWSPSLASGTGFFNPKIDVPGRYTYTVENDCGMDLANIEVSVYESVKMDDYSISIEASENNRNTVILNVDSTLPYEFSLDGIYFQREPVFYNVSGGAYTLIGREIAGCSYFEEKLLLVGHASFFTPNGDGVNDTWFIKGTSNQNYNLYIYDRYGKLLKNLETSQAWDGTFNGLPLPSSDYWFKLVFEDGTSKVGHFTLKR